MNIVYDRYSRLSHIRIGSYSNPRLFEPLFLRLRISESLLYVLGKRTRAKTSILFNKVDHFRTLTVRVRVGVGVRVWARVCACACVCARMSARVRARVSGRTYALACVSACSREWAHVRTRVCEGVLVRARAACLRVRVPAYLHVRVSDCL